MAKGWNEVVWNEAVMERSGRNSFGGGAYSSKYGIYFGQPKYCFKMYYVGSALQ